MKYKQWLAVLSTININNDLNKSNVIEKIKEKLRAVDRNIYKKWKKDNFDVNHITDSKKRTPLHLAAVEGHAEAVKALIDKGANVHAAELNNMTPLHLAAVEGHTEAVKALIDKGANVHAAELNNMTPLHLAAEEGHAEVIKALIDKGANVHAAELNNMTPLHLAAVEGHTEAVKALIDKGANVHAAELNNVTPLHLAAEEGHAEVIKVLIDRGAEINVMNRERLTPLYFAAKSGCQEAVYALMEKGADPLLGNKNKTLKYLTELIGNGNLKQLQKEQKDDRYELLKYSLLHRGSRSLIDIVGEDGFDSLTYTWFADTSGLTPNQKKLNKELLSILQDYQSLSKGGDGRNSYVVKLEEFLQDNKNNQDLEIVLNLRRGEAKLTILHVISSMAGIEEEYDNSVALLLEAGAKHNIKDDRGKTPLHYAISSNSVHFLLEKGANPSISDSEGKTPLDIAIDNCRYSVEKCLLTDEQEKLQQELYDVLCKIDVGEDNLSSLSKGLIELKEFLNRHKDIHNLKRVLNLHNDKGGSRVLKIIGSIYHNDETLRKEAERLLLEAGAVDYKVLERKEHLPKSETLWDILILNQKKKLEVFSARVNAAQNMNELEQVVNQAIESGIRFNFPHQGKLYGKMYESKYSFMDYVIKKIKEISELEKNFKVASDIVCKLVSRGAVLYNINSICIIDTLESEFKDHKTNLVGAYEDYVNRTLKFAEIVKSATSGRVIDAKLDNSTTYLEYSEDSTIDVAKITDGARVLGLTHGIMEYGRDLIKVGKSEVEIITANGIRCYTDLADGSDIVLTFHTSLGELEVRLYPDKQDKGRITVEVQDQGKWEKLKSCNEEIGTNCLLGGYSVYDAIEQGYFERHGKFQSSETISLSKRVSEEVKAAVKDLKCGDIVNSLSGSISLLSPIQESTERSR